MQLCSLLSHKIALEVLQLPLQGLEVGGSLSLGKVPHTSDVGGGHEGPSKPTVLPGPCQFAANQVVPHMLTVERDLFR